MQEAMTEQLMSLSRLKRYRQRIEGYFSRTSIGSAQLIIEQAQALKRRNEPYPIFIMEAAELEHTSIMEAAEPEPPSRPACPRSPLKRHEILLKIVAA